MPRMRFINACLQSDWGMQASVKEENQTRIVLCQVTMKSERARSQKCLPANKTKLFVTTRKSQRPTTVTAGIEYVPSTPYSYLQIVMERDSETSFTVVFRRCAMSKETTYIIALDHANKPLEPLSEQVKIWKEFVVTCFKLGLLFLNSPEETK